MFFMNSESMLSSFSFSGIMDSVAEAMIELESSASNFVAPLRSSVALEKDVLMLMPCLSRTDWGLKVLTLFPDNPESKKPFINGVFLLFDAEDGHPTAILDGRTLTALRTGGVGGLAVRTLSDPRATRLGVVGTGVQGYWQARFGCSGRSFSLLTLYDSMEPQAQECAEKLKKDLPDLEIRIAKNTSELLENSDVVMTATTASVPVFEDKPALFERKTLVGIGSYRPDMREYPDAVFRAVPNIFVDTEHAFEETGDLISPLASGVIRREDIPSLGSLLAGSQKSVFSAGSGAFFKSVGFSAFDLFVARYLFQQGVQLGKGVDLDF